MLSFLSFVQVTQSACSDCLEQFDNEADSLICTSVVTNYILVLVKSTLEHCTCIFSSSSSYSEASAYLF